MSGTNTTIQDTNPTFITYSAGWIYNNSDARYDSSDHHATTKFGSTVTVRFEGNGIEVTGAMKPEYGTYSVELDGRVALNTSSFSRTQLFRQRLFRLRDLSNGPHVIRVINTGNRGTGFDVDTFTFLALPTTPPTTPTSDMNSTNIIIGAILAAIGVFALIVIVILLRRLPRYKREKRGLYGGGSSETLVQARPYDYVPSDDSANRRSKYNDQGLPNVPAPAFMGSPVSAQPPTTHRRTPVISGPNHSHTPLPYLANDMSRYRSTTVTSQSSTSSFYSENLAQRLPVRNSVLSVYVPEASLRPVSSVRSASFGSGSIRPAVRPLSIAGRPGSIRPTIPESPFEAKRVYTLYTTQPTIREYSKRDTIFGKRSMDDRGRVDLLADDDVPGTGPAHRTEFASPRQVPRPLMSRSVSLASTAYVRPPQPVPNHDGPPRLELNTAFLSSIIEPTPSIEWSPSLSTIRFATRPNSGVNQAPSTIPSRSNSKGESLFSPTLEQEKRLSMGSKSQKERRRSSIPPLPSLPEPEPEPEPIAYVPLAPPPPVTRHKRAADSFGSVNSANGFAIGTPKSTMLNSPMAKNNPFVGLGLPNGPRPVRVVSPRSPPRSRSRSPPFTLGTNAHGTPRSSGMRMGMRMVDLEAGVVGVVEDKRGWSRVRSMMGVVGDMNKDEALFELVASTPPLPSPVHRHGQGHQQGQGRGQWQGQRLGQGHGRTQTPRVALPGTVGGPRVLKKPAPLALGGLSNFESPVYGSGANGVRKRFVREVVATGKTGTPPGIDSSPRGWKKMSILQSAVIHGRANKEEVELVTGMKMDI